MIEFTYLEQPPKRYTFEQPQLKKWVEQHRQGKVLNLFAGKTLLKVDEIRVDLDPSMPAQYHVKAEEFVDFAIEKGLKFDTIVLDPPYNVRKSREKYKGRYIGSFTKLKRKLPFILNDKGLMITLGYNSTGFPKKMGFKKIAVCLVCHKGDHSDTIVLVERKTTSNLY